MRNLYVYDFLKDSLTDSESIRKCLSAAKETNEEVTIIFDRKDWHITEAILLSSNTTFVIDNCAVLQMDGTFDNVFRGENVVIDPKEPYGKPLFVNKLENIRIIGKNGARIVGCSRNKKGYHFVLNEEEDMVGDFWGYRTHQISISNCTGFEISGLCFTKVRGWTMSFDSCSNGKIQDIHIVSDVKNGDGIDFRSGCHDCTVENIYGYTSDDTVACTAINQPSEIYPIENYLYPSEPYNVLRKSSENQRNYDIYNITVANIFTGGQHHGVICLAANRQRVHHVSIKNIKEAKKGHREATVKIYTGYGTNYTAGDLHDIVIEDIESHISQYVFLCNARVKAVLVRNAKQNLVGGELMNSVYNDDITVL